MTEQTLTVQLMHANARIAELRKFIDDSGHLQQELYAQIASLQADLDYARMCAQPVATTKRSLPAHFVAAREAAMRLGKCVKVSTNEVNA